MNYYEDENLLIRDLAPEDGPVFTAEEQAQGWHTALSKFKTRLRDRAEGRAVALVALWKGSCAGYINVYLGNQWGPFGGQGLPEIVDFCVLQKFQRKGIGGKLLDAAEAVAARYADTVYLSVGLHNGFGAAQRIYIKRSYIPDGSGIWYRDKPCVPYEDAYPIDDELVLYLSKKLK